MSTTFRNPSFLEMTRFPYWKGPNYERPVFMGDTGQRVFREQPLQVIGFGEDPLPLPQPLTPEEACSSFTGSTRTKCIEFNRDMMAQMAKDPQSAAAWNAKVQAATDKCKSMEGDFNAWGACFYAANARPWYTNPLYLGASAVALAGLAMLVSSLSKGQR